MTAQTYQFIRIEPYQAAKTNDLLLEAGRAPSHSSHVAFPLPPTWVRGSEEAIRLAVDTYMMRPQEVRRAGGGVSLRTPRIDQRAILGCVTTYPVETSTLLGAPKEDNDLFEKWIDDVLDFVSAEFGNNFIGTVLHIDESHPHLHHYIVGSAVRLHPGLRAELEDGRRIHDAKERLRRYREAMKDFLNRFHLAVGLIYGHGRNGRIRPGRRVKDRKTYLKEKELGLSILKFPEIANANFVEDSECDRNYPQQR